MNIILVRHGEIPSNVNKIYAGRSPEELTDKGIAQAEKVSGELKKYQIDAIYSSPIRRAVQTAEIINKDAGSDLTINNAFRELDMGPWEGMSEADVAKMYPDEWKVWNNMPAELKLPGRETLDELLARVLKGIRTVLEDGYGENIVIVTHVAIIRVLLLWHSKESLNLYKTIHVPNAEVFNRSIGQDLFR